MLRSKVAALRSQAAVSGNSPVQRGMVARGQSGRKRVCLVKALRVYPMKPRKQREDVKSLAPKVQESLLHSGVAPAHLFDVLQGKEPGDGDLFGKRKRGDSRPKPSKVEEEEDDDDDSSLLNSPLFYAYAHMETADGEVLYGKWPSDSGCTCIDQPVIIGPEFDIYLTAKAAGSTYSNTTKPLLYVSTEESMVIRPKELTLQLLFGLLSYSGVMKTDIYKVMDTLITSLLEDERCQDLRVLSRLVKKQKPDPEHDLWHWPPSPMVYSIPKEAVEVACKRTAAQLGIGEDFTPWAKMLGTVRGRRYFFYREVQRVEYYFRGCGLLDKTVQRSMGEGLLRLRPQSLENLVKVLTEGDPFRLCFYNLSPVNAILPELPSVSYRYIARDKKRIPVARLTAVAIYQEALKRDCNPLLQPRFLTKEGLEKVSVDERPLVKPVYYVHSQDKRPGAATEDDSGHCFTHLSTLTRLFPSPQYNVLEGVKLLSTHKIVAIAPAMCSDDGESERHIYLRSLYQQTLDLVASLVEIERRALVLRPKPPQHPDQCLRYRNSPMCKIPHSEDQCRAVEDAVAVGSPGIILTGCAGTGKTATCAKIAAYYPSEKIISFAPTGKASDLLDKRVAPSDTGHHYYYKHKRNKGGGGGSTQESSEDSELPKSLFEDKEQVIVDEGSLMPLWLLSKLLRDIVQNSRVHRFLICGDPDQLPSVEAGSVLSDLVYAYSQLDSEYADWTKRLHQLAICHRAESREIYDNAMAIKAMRVEDIQSTDNFVILESQGNVREDAEMLFDFMEEKIGLERMRDDFHVLCSQNKYVDIVNEIAYRRYWKALDDAEDRNSDLRHNRGYVCQSGGDGQERKRSRPRRFRVGCRIFFKKNIRPLGIKNGKMLTILGYRDEDKTTGQVVRLPDGALPLQHQYDRDDLIRGNNSHFRRIAICKVHDGGADAIFEIPLDKASLNSSLCSLAYCTTVHKVQGTEFDYCGVILAKKEPRMVTSTWFYTGETRAKRTFIVATAEDTFREVIARPRLTRLSDVSVLLVKALRQLRTTVQLGLPMEATTQETVWWNNKAGVKPFTAYPHWNRDVPHDLSTTTSPSTTSSSSAHADNV